MLFYCLKNKHTAVINQNMMHVCMEQGNSENYSSSVKECIPGRISLIFFL